MTRKDDKVDRILELAIRLEEKQDALTSKVDTIAESVKDTRSRVSLIEVWKGRVVGYAAAIATILSIMAQFIFETLRR
jgi:hypothetical protein